MNSELRHMESLASTGLQEEAPVRNESGTFQDSPTTLDVAETPAENPVYARLTTRIESAGSRSLSGSSWIWYPDDDPAWDLNEPSASATRYFRKSVDLDAAPTSATLVFTADNLATASINGTQVGTSADGFDGDPSDSWQYAPALDVTDQLSAGENVLAVQVERFEYYAGFIGRLVLEFDDETQTIDTDGSWLASQSAPDGWRSVDFDDSGWPAAQVLGEYGLSPWGQQVSVASPPGQARLAFTAGDEVAHTDPVAATDTGIRTTGWERVPATFDGGTVTLQTANARVTVATLELAVRHER